MRTRPEASSFKTNHVVRVVRVVQVVIIRSKSNNESLEVYISDFTPRLTAVVLDGFLLRAISEPDLVLPLILLLTYLPIDIPACIGSTLECFGQWQYDYVASWASEQKIGVE